MATSGTYTFSVSRDDIIRQSMLNIKKLGEYEIPTPGQTQDVARVLNMVVKQWQAKQDFANGLKVWTRRHATLFLGAAQFQYNVGPSGDHWTASYKRNSLASAAAANATTITLAAGFTAPASGDFIGIVLTNGTLFWTTVSGTPVGAVVTLATGLTSAASGSAYVYSYTTKAQRPEMIETAVLRDSNYIDGPLQLYTLQEYDFLPSKQSPNFVSDPTAIYYEAQLTNGVIYIDVYGASDVTKNLYISYLEPIQDFNNPTDTPEYPAAWFLPLCWETSKQIAPMFKANWTPDMEENRKNSIAIAKEGFVETSALFFQPYQE